MQIELRQIGSDRLLESIEVESLAEVPHPGRWLVIDQRSFLVLQRSHRYQLCNGSYELATVALQVKAQVQPRDALWWQNQWVIGNPDCHFNARSPLLRCAVFPDGPCTSCGHYRPRPDGP
ncbi:DUF6464 family protein [Cyanobium sp. WAJ14-Wanaka]|uniref:DUF6464 family protein n=1 Tax=Cyanobium sp. WAJ14-Wanaka TaxID=2823725 RepID=UPI0020CD6961|nr:DUF6464 family protein [Cyanobium sp. WAJ14-Wanaka]MCP9774401.1 hypothetical protein [Cyanobium sp. WAJ14-Wanaka]